MRSHPSKGRAVQSGSIIVVAALAIFLASCSQEVEYSDQQRACIAQRYKEFDARKLSQCVDVCKACMNGNTVTCNTSCKLKGAS
jgi:PBP1b-binding outer membrane lipoprotein LpoB